MTNMISEALDLRMGYSNWTVLHLLSSVTSTP